MKNSSNKLQRFESHHLTSAGLDSTVIADMALAVRDMDTGKAVSVRPAVRKSPELFFLLSTQAKYTPMQADTPNMRANTT